MSADCEREIGYSLDRDAKGTLVGGICEGERLYKPANTRLLDVIPEYTRSGRVHRPRDNPSAYLRREVSSSVPTRCTGVRAQRSLDGHRGIPYLACTLMRVRCTAV